MTNRTCIKCGATFAAGKGCAQCRATYRRNIRERALAASPERKCIICGAMYRSPYKQSLSCSPACGRERERQLLGQTALPVEPRTCPICSVAFLARNTNHAFCSDPCSEAARWKRRYADAGYMARRKELTQSSNARRHAKDAIRYNESTRRYRALKRAALTSEFTTDQLSARMDYWGSKCWMCGVAADSLDHVKPLSKGGAHMLSNFRPACRRCNSSKGGRWFGVSGLHRFIKN